MKTKFFSILAMLLFSMSLTFGFASCSDDDDDNNTENNPSSSDTKAAGKAAGEKFIQDLEAYQAIEGSDANALVKKTEALTKIYGDYTNYKTNKEDKEWKEAFLKGAAKEDVKKYETLNSFLEKDYSSITSIASALTDLLSLLGSNSNN
ncbi:MAG: hypothetical protein MJZ33_13385 [Paludibacteraceae bacterium]|nr:hypothetical protein [Paludibacteraceae bacterium]